MGDHHRIALLIVTVLKSSIILMWLWHRYDMRRARREEREDRRRKERGE